MPRARYRRVRKAMTSSRCSIFITERLERSFCGSDERDLLHGLCYPSADDPFQYSGDQATAAILSLIHHREGGDQGEGTGVFFRNWTVQNARELGLNGWVRNRRDGSVEAVFSGEPAKVQEMVDRRCRVGPPAAVVTALHKTAAAAGEETAAGEGFHCRPTA